MNSTKQRNFNALIFLLAILMISCAKDEIPFSQNTDVDNSIRIPIEISIEDPGTNDLTHYGIEEESPNDSVENHDPRDIKEVIPDSLDHQDVSLEHFRDAP